MTNDTDVRSSKRSSSLYAVTIAIGDRFIPGKARDHSATGCRVVLDEAVRAEDRTVTIERGGMEVEACIAWRDDRTIGLVFDGTPPDGMFAPRTVESAPVSAHVRFAPGERTRRPGLRSHTSGAQA